MQIASSPPLLHYDSQVHTLVNGTIEVKSAGGGKWSNRLCCIAANLHIINGRGTRLFLGIGGTVFPRPIRDVMRSAAIIYQNEALALFERDRCLLKIIPSHMDLISSGWTAARCRRRRAAASREGSEQGQAYQ